MNNSKIRVARVFAAPFALAALGLFLQACGATGAGQQRVTTSAVVSSSPTQR